MIFKQPWSKYKGKWFIEDDKRYYIFRISGIEKFPLDYICPDEPNLIYNAWLNTTTFGDGVFEYNATNKDYYDIIKKVFCK